MKATIVRLETGENENIGVLVLDNKILCYTLELAWRNNEKEVSCIPIGNYRCKRVKSPKFGNTFEITGVFARDSILFHKGNTHLDSLGCVLLGSDVGYLKSNRAVLASKNAFNLFLEALEGLNEFDLSIMMI